MGSRKKAKEIQQVSEVVNQDNSIPANPCLTPAQYWEWRCAIADMSTCRSEKNLADSQLIAMRKDIEIASLKAKLFELVQIESAKTKLENSTEAYNENKKQLEMVHKISLNGKIIDEVTYEIKELQA